MREKQVAQEAASEYKSSPVEYFFLFFFFLVVLTLGLLIALPGLAHAVRTFLGAPA